MMIEAPVMMNSWICKVVSNKASRVTSVQDYGAAPHGRPSQTLRLPTKTLRSGNITGYSPIREVTIGEKNFGDLLDTHLAG